MITVFVQTSHFLVPTDVSKLVYVKIFKILNWLKILSKSAYLKRNTEYSQTRRCFIIIELLRLW